MSEQELQIWLDVILDLANRNTIQRCIDAAKLERVGAIETGEEGDIAYNRAIEHVIDALHRLKDAP